MAEQQKPKPPSNEPGDPDRLETEPLIKGDPGRLETQELREGDRRAK